MDQSETNEDIAALLADGDRVRIVATGAAPAEYQGAEGTIQRLNPGQDQTTYTVLFDRRDFGFWTFPAWALEIVARKDGA